MTIVTVKSNRRYRPRLEAWGPHGQQTKLSTVRAAIPGICRCHFCL